MMIYAGIVNRNIIEPFEVNESVKLNSTNDCESFEWYKRQPCSFKTKCILMHDNAPSHASHLAREFLECNRFAEDRIMQWLSSGQSANRNSMKKANSMTVR